MSNCKLQEMLRKDPDKWLKEIQNPPYNLIVKQKDGLYLFKYHQIDSDFSEQIVREARGIILDSRNNWTICCRAFDKFFNYGEQYASEIDWKTAIATEKSDGSLIKMWNYEGTIGISTNGTIDASDAGLQLPYINEGGFEISDYFDLVFDTLRKMNIEMDNFNIEEGETAIFELCTPYNRVVVPHKDFKLYYLASRISDTGVEFRNHTISGIFPMPKMFKAGNLDGIVEMVKELPYDEEGYVIVDSYCNRIKVKSPAYIAIHHLKGEGVPSKKRMLDLIRSGEHEEFLNYFPEFKDVYWEVHGKWLDFKNRLFLDLEEYEKHYRDVDRKTLALWATKETQLPGLIFSIADNKCKDLEKFLEESSSEKILKWMGE